MKTIEIKVECKGHAVGTLGWLNSLLNDSELTVKRTKDGTPGMFLKTKDEKGNISHKFICRKWDRMEDPMGYNLRSNDTLLSINASGDPNYERTFSDHPLTPACQAKVQELIDKACEEFEDWWENH